MSAAARELLSPVIAKCRAAATDESLEIARQAEVEIEDARLEELQAKPGKLSPEEATEQRVLQAGQETRDALADAEVEASDVTPAPQAPLPSGAPGPLLLNADAVREYAKAQGKAQGGDGNGEGDGEDSGDSVNFASDEAAEAAVAAGLSPEDFEDVEPSGAGGFTKADVEAVAKGRE